MPWNDERLFNDPGNAIAIDADSVNDAGLVYTDANAEKWTIHAVDRGDGWTQIDMRPTQPEYYAVEAGRWPVTMLSATYESGKTPQQTWHANLDQLAEQVESYAAERKPSKGGSKGGTLLLVLLALWLIGSDKRRYHGARDEQVF